MATVTVLYPAGELDLDYYMNKHVPLVAETWASYGLKGYEIVTFGPGQPFQLQATLRWDSIESLGKAPMAEIEADVKNYTSLQPISVAGETKSLVSL